MALLQMNDLKIGAAITLDGSPFVVTSTQHSKMGRGGAVMRTKLKNLESGRVLEKTFTSADKIEDAQIEKEQAQFLYREATDYFFMHSTSFEQFRLTEDDLGDARYFLNDGDQVDLLTYRGRPISVNLPASIVLTVERSEPGIKGNSATASTKPATTSTGLTLQVPLFVGPGQKVRVDTRTLQYLERA
jgi:elongation factor P